MGIFDQPMDYRMRSPQTIYDFKERFERLQFIWNKIVELLLEPIEKDLSKSEFDLMIKEAKFIKKQFKRIADDPFSFNHRTLNKLAYKLVDFSRLCFFKKEDLGIITRFYAFGYDNKYMNISLNGEDYWYLGR